MRLNRLFKEDFRRGRRLPPIDLPFEIPAWKWTLVYKIPMQSYTRGDSNDVWHEVTNINAAIENMRDVELRKLWPHKFIMYAHWDNTAPEFKQVHDLLIPPEPVDSSFHTDDEFGGANDSLVVVMEGLHNESVETYCTLEVDNSISNADFRPATNKLLEKIYRDTLSLINRKIAEEQY